MDAEGSAAYNKNEESKKPAFKVPVVDVIETEDTFAAVFISSLMLGKSLGRRLKLETRQDPSL